MKDWIITPLVIGIVFGLCAINLFYGSMIALFVSFCLNMGFILIFLTATKRKPEYIDYSKKGSQSTAKESEK